MDNRFIFLYCILTELQGRIVESRPGAESPEQAYYGQGWQIRLAYTRGSYAQRTKVAKSEYAVPRKAAIAQYVPVP